jgi:riboflavin synthase
MFTGIIQQQGLVHAIEEHTLLVDALTTEPWELGESVAINGCCLTVVAWDPLRFDLSDETLSRTNLGHLKPGDHVNLERAMRPTDRFGGHIVQGHVEGLGRILAIDPSEDGVTFRFAVDGDRYLIDKGSIAIDGISLTVIDPSHGEFKVAVIPHTLKATNLGSRSIGDSVNIEYDVIAKHVEKLLKSWRDRGERCDSSWPPL